MMGAPFTAGAVSKAWLSDGARAASMDWAILVLWASSLLNAGYFLPILWRSWSRRAPAAAWPAEHIPMQGWRETTWLLLLPPLVTAAATIAAGILADTDFSPLAWAKLIAAREYLESAP
jgi:multicomponent Na+:H+ antiporter subunit D